MEVLGEFLVTPKELQKEAVLWQEMLRKGSVCCENIEKQVSATERCLKGWAGELFRKNLISYSRQEAEQLKSLLELTKKLEEIAAVYQQAEGENKNVAIGN